MNIAFVSDAIWPYNKGGKEKRLFEISTNLAQKGHHVTIYCMKWWENQKYTKIENGVHLHAVSNYYPLYAGNRRSVRQAILFSLACFRLMKEDFEVMDVDHVPHLVLFPIKLICLLKRKKMIATWQEVWGLDYWKQYLGIMGYVAYGIEYITARLPDEIIAVSEHTKRKLISELHVKNSVLAITNSVNFSEIQQIPPAKERSDVIYAGRLLSHKNVDILIQSIAVLKKRLPFVKCLIIGEGPEKIHLKHLVNELHLADNVVFLDFITNQNQLYAFMKSSKVFVLPSTREGFGIVAIEANACGIPVITINHKDNAAKDLVSVKKNGLTCRLDINEIAEHIKTILTTGLDDSMKQICLDSAKLYDWKRTVLQVEKAYLL